MIVWLAMVLPWALVASTRTGLAPWASVTPVNVKCPLASDVVVPSLKPSADGVERDGQVRVRRADQIHGIEVGEVVADDSRVGRRVKRE